MVTPSVRVFMLCPNSSLFLLPTPSCFSHASVLTLDTSFAHKWLESSSFFPDFFELYCVHLATCLHVRYTVVPLCSQRRTSVH